MCFRRKCNVRRPESKQKCQTDFCTSEWVSQNTVLVEAMDAAEQEDEYRKTDTNTSVSVLR